MKNIPSKEKLTIVYKIALKVAIRKLKEDKLNAKLN